MFWTLRRTAPALLVFTMATRLSAEPTAEPTAGPPAWSDQASVYLAKSQAAAEESPESAAEPEPSPSAASATAAATVPPATAIANVDAAASVEDAATPAVTAAPFQPASSAPSGRYLAPPSARHEAAGHDANQNSANAASRRLAALGVPTQSVYTVLSALAIVVGAFLLLVWVSKRGGRGAGHRGSLPADVVSVLGRVPLATRQFAELLRVGNKLVLVSLTPTGAETLTEVTDPAEVDRLVGLCQQNNPFSTTKAFEHVFQQMSYEPAPGGFLGNASPMTPPASPAGAYRANRGGPLRG